MPTKKIKDLSPKMRVPTLADELHFPSSFQDQTAQILGGLQAGSSELRHGKIRIQGVAERMLFGDVVDYDEGIGVFVGLHDDVYKFRAGDPEGTQIAWDGGGLSIGGFLEEGEAAADVNSNVTTITGAKITTGTVALGKLDFVPLSSSGATGAVIATINASAEGIRIAADNITISGSTTFSAGYDPTGYEDAAGVTTIIGNTITTGFVDALGVTAKYVVASIAMSAPTITGGTIIGTTIKTRASGARVELAAAAATIKFFDAGNDRVFEIDEDTYASIPVVRVASYDNRGLWLDSNDGIYITADVDLYLGVGTGSIVIADDTYMGGNLDMNAHTISEVGFLSMGGNLDMNNHNISEIATATMTNCHATVGIFYNAIEVDDIYDEGQGHIEIHDGLYISDDMTIDDGVWIGGGLTVVGSKDFLIPHPDKSNRLLKYSCIESPEVAVSYRGILELTTEVEFIPVPKHFELVTEPHGLITVQITPIGENTVHVIDTPTNAGFNVKGIPGTKVMFEITAIRKGFLNNEVEIDLGKNIKSPFGKQHLKRMKMKEISTKKKK